MTFIVRIFADEKGGITGVVEQVRTGRKEAIHAVDDIGRVIAAMVSGEGDAEPGVKMERKLP